MTNIEKLVSVAKAEVGVKESPAGSNKVKYNTWYYGRAVSGSKYPWCAVFICWCYTTAGLADLFYGGKKSASCTSIRDYYKKLGMLVTDGKYQAGDLGIFNFSGKKDKNTGLLACEHIGLITGVSGKKIFTVEGNTGSGNEANGGCVMERERDVANIVDVARPNYSGKAAVVKKKYTPTKAKIRTIQKILNDMFSFGLDVDGVVGPKTKSALVMGAQASMNEEYGKRLKIDGVFGAETRKATPDVCKNANGKLVKIIQSCLCIKQSSISIDGKFGSKTFNAVTAFQEDNALEKDGVVGKETMEALLK